MFYFSADPWWVTPEERAKHDAQFFQLKPVAGFVTGEWQRKSTCPTDALGHQAVEYVEPWIAQLRSCWNPLNEDKRIFSVNLVSVMAADVLAPGLAKASADMLHSLACKKKIAWVVSFQFTVECAEFLGQSESLPRW